MLELIQLSKEEFLEWMKVQLEKREVWPVRKVDRNKLKEAVYEILFYEQGLTAEEIERFFIPYSQSGYLSTRQKFEIMLYVLEKDYGNSYLFLGGNEQYYAVTEEDIEEIYVQWLQEERLFLSEEDKKDFFIQTILDNFELGLLEVLKRVAPDGILLGEFCPPAYEQEAAETRIAVCAGGAVIRLLFLELQNQEELILLIKCVLAAENKGELTLMEPVLDFVKEDGTCITAVRPPEREDWGIRILYGAGKKGGIAWKK